MYQSVVAAQLVPRYKYCWAVILVLILLPELPSGQDCLYNTSVGSVWLDYSDAARDGVFLDSTGVAPGYMNWYPGDPNGLHGDECVQADQSRNWSWVDVPCRYIFHVVCQYSEKWHGPSPEGHYYYQVPFMVGSKTDVQAQCNARTGGILPRATSEADLQFAWDKAATVPFGIPSSQGIWLELEPTSGQWSNSTGAGPQFTNGDRSGNGTCYAFFSDTKWRDTPCSQEHLLICLCPYCMQPYISNGSILEAKSKYVDEQAKVACDTSFDLDGDPAITCTCKGQWAAAKKFPECVSTLRARSCAWFGNEMTNRKCSTIAGMTALVVLLILLLVMLVACRFNVCGFRKRRRRNRPNDDM